MSNKPIQVDVASNEKVTFREYFSYGLSNSGGTVVFSVFASLVTIFWTDYAGMDPIVITEVVAISKIFDAISNLVFGYFIQQTRTRWGQARPWMLWTAIPFSISAVACFTIPVNASETFKWWYAFVAYNFLSTIMYTVTDLAEGTLCSMMSRDPVEREKLGAFRLGLCTIGHFLAGGLTIPLAKMMGNDQKAWVTLMTIWGIYAAIVHLNCFFQCKERVVIEVEAYNKKPPIPQQIKALLSSQYWWWAIIYWGVWATFFAIMGTTMTYYCRYILLNDNLYSVYFIVEKVFFGAACLYCPTLRRKTGWSIRKLMVVGCLVAMVGQLSVALFPNSPGYGLFAVIIRGLGTAMPSGFFNGVIANVTDFGHYKTHQRQESLTFAAASMGEKIGNGTLLALVTLCLSISGFVSSTTGGATQPQSALNMIRYLYIYGNSACLGLLAFICSCYKLDGKMEMIQAELRAREARGEL